MDTKTVRESLIELLDYPRFIAEQKIDLQDCRHSSFYNRSDPACRTCDNEAECRWLNGHDERSVLESKSDRELITALDFAIDFVDSQRHISESKMWDLDCASWLQEARCLRKSLTQDLCA